MKAYDKDLTLYQRLVARYDVLIHTDDCRILRRAECTLHRWAERECGDDSGWHIERDEQTDFPYNVPNDGNGTRHRIPDLEKGALRRIAEVCARNSLHYYHQTDPRGCSLYVSPLPLTDTNYTNGVPCSVL